MAQGKSQVKAIHEFTRNGTKRDRVWFWFVWFCGSFYKLEQYIDRNELRGLIPSLSRRVRTQAMRIKKGGQRARLFFIQSVAN